MQQSRFDPNHPDYDGGGVAPTVMPPISDPNHPKHAEWSAQFVGNTPAEDIEAARSKPKRARKAKKATAKAGSK